MSSADVLPSVVDPKPIPLVLHCPECGERHVDEGVFATKHHHTHSCQFCGLTWRPAVVFTVGVRFLPGFKNETSAPEGEDLRTCLRTAGYVPTALMFRQAGELESITAVADVLWATAKVLHDSSLARHLKGLSSRLHELRTASAPISPSASTVSPDQTLHRITTSADTFLCGAPRVYVADGHRYTAYGSTETKDLTCIACLRASALAVWSPIQLELLEAARQVRAELHAGFAWSNGEKALHDALARIDAGEAVVARLDAGEDEGGRR